LFPVDHPCVLSYTSLNTLRDRLQTHRRRVRRRYAASSNLCMTHCQGEATRDSDALKDAQSQQALMLTSSLRSLLRSSSSSIPNYTLAHHPPPSNAPVFGTPAENIHVAFDNVMCTRQPCVCARARVHACQSSSPFLQRQCRSLHSVEHVNDIIFGPKGQGHSHPSPHSKHESVYLATPRHHVPRPSSVTYTRR